MTFDDSKTFARPFTLRMDKTLTPDTEIIEDVCENERDSSHLESGIKGAPEILAKYAGTYQFGAGREVVVTALGYQLSIADSANPKDRLFVARSETVFLSSVSHDVVEFFRESQGAVIYFVRTTGAGKDEKAVRNGGLPNSLHRAGWAVREV